MRLFLLLAALIVLPSSFSSASTSSSVSTTPLVDAAHVLADPTPALADTGSRTTSGASARGARQLGGSTVCPTCINLARSCGTNRDEACPTSQTSTLQGGSWDSSRGNDGNPLTAFQTYGNGYQEWTVTLGAGSVIEDIVLTNYDRSPYMERLEGAQLDVLDGNGNVKASRTLTGEPGEQTYAFAEQPVGTTIRISKTVESYQNLHLKEVEVYGPDPTPAGYSYSGFGGCSGRNELGGTTGGSVQDCADGCDAEPTCVSFEYAKVGTTCQRSTTCDSLDLTVNDPTDPYGFYLKLPQEAGPASSTASTNDGDASTGDASTGVAVASTTGDASTSTVCPTCINLARSCGTNRDEGCPTSQASTHTSTSTGHTYDSSYGVDGDKGSAFQTGDNGYQEWTVTLGAGSVIDNIVLTNFDASPYMERLEGAQLDVLDADGNVKASRTLTGDAGSQTYAFAEQPVGTTVRISKTVESYKNLHLYEVEVYGPDPTPASTSVSDGTGDGTASTGDASTTGDGSSTASTNDGTASTGDASTTGDDSSTASSTQEAAEAVKAFAEATAAYKEAEYNLDAVTTMCADLTEIHDHHAAELNKSTLAYQQAVTYEAMMKQAYDLAMTKDSTPAERFRLRIEAEEKYKAAKEAMDDAKAVLDAADVAEVAAKSKCDICCYDADANCPSGEDDCVGMAAMKEAQAKPIYEAAKLAVETNPLIPQDINAATKDFVYQDVDSDLIPDAFDACPTLAGLRRNTAKRTSADKPGPQDFCPSGCPEVDPNNEVVDSDGDGINDCEDRCPFKPGIRYNHNWSYGVDLSTLPRELDYNGCPDKDNDGIPDVFDACPTRAGGKCYSGCPDKGIDSATDLPWDLDMDGVSDCDDQCPGHYNPDGPNGCADADNDGTPDFRDYCFMSPGFASFSFDRKLEDEPSTPTAGYWVPGKTKHLNILGCPDRDSDLVPDQADFCLYGNQDAANYPGLKFVPVVGRNGCPLDSDQDGVHDGIDQCDNTVHSPKPEHGRAHRVYKPEADDYIPDTGDYRLGCPKDTDGDGFPDGYDQCPDQGGFVDRVGCPVDTDDDGVGDCSSDELLDIITWPLTTTACHSRVAAPDESCCNVVKDMCPNTPRGAKAYPKVFAHPTLGDIEPGCPFDSDLDGVFDGIDRCPKTTSVELTKAANEPHKLKIDQVGCALLAARVWESTFVGLTPDSRRRLQSGDGSDLELVFSVDESLPQVLTTNGYDVQQDMVAPEVMDASCQMSINDETADDELIPTTSSVNDMGDYTGLMPNEQVPVKVDLSISGENIVDSDVWSSEPPYDSGSASFCVSVPVLDDTGGHVTEKQMKTNLDYDMSQGLGMLGEGDVTIEEYETIITTTKVIDISYPINACQCTTNNECVEDSDLDDSFLSQSSSLRICVRFAPDEKKEGALPPNYVKMMNIKTFQCTQNGVTFAAISNFKRQGDGGQLTSVKVIDDGPEEGSYYGEDDRMITVDSRLPATFFGKEERPVTCVGSIVYEYADGEIIDPNGNVLGRRRMLAEAFIAPSGRTNSQPGSIEITEPQGKFSWTLCLASASGIGAIVGSVVASVAVVASVGVIGVKYGSAITGSFSGKPTTPANFNDVTSDTEASWSTSSNEGPSSSDFNVRFGMVA